MEQIRKNERYMQTEQQKNKELYLKDTQEKINEIKQVQELFNVI
jgi:hypothetical protein